MVTPLLPPPPPVSCADLVEDVDRKLCPIQRETAMAIRARRKNPAGGRGSDKPTTPAPKGGVE